MQCSAVRLSLVMIKRLFRDIDLCGRLLTVLQNESCISSSCASFFSVLQTYVFHTDPQSLHDEPDATYIA